LITKISVFCLSGNPKKMATNRPPSSNFYV